MDFFIFTSKSASVLKKYEENLFQCVCHAVYSGFITGKPGNRLYDIDGKIHLKQKTPAEVIGEKLLAPVINSMSGFLSYALTIVSRINTAFQFPVANAATVESSFQVTPDNYTDHSTPTDLSATTMHNGKVVIGWARDILNKNGLWQSAGIYMRAYNTSGDLKDVQQVSIGGGFPFLAPLPTGVVMTWSSIYFQKYDNDCKKIGSAVNFPARNSYDLGAATLYDGSLTIAWEAASYMRYRIYMRVYDPSGFYYDQVISPLSVQADQRFPSLVSLDDKIVVVWTSWIRNQSDPASGGIYMQICNSAGFSIGTEQKITSSNAVSVITSVSDGIVIIWKDFTHLVDGFLKIFGQKYDRFFDRVGTVFEVGAFERGISDIPRNWGDFLRKPAVTSLKDGGIVCVWFGTGKEGGWKLLGQRFDSFMNAVGGNFIVSQDGSHPHVAPLNDGGFLSVWIQSDNSHRWQVYAQRFNKQGEKVMKDGSTPPHSPLDLSPYGIPWWGYLLGSAGVLCCLISCFAACCRKDDSSLNSTREPEVKPNLRRNFYRNSYPSSPTLFATTNSSSVRARSSSIECVTVPVKRNGFDFYGDYVGYWLNDLKHGKGRDKEYDGHWFKDKKHGIGNKRCGEKIYDLQLWDNGDLLKNQQFSVTTESVLNKLNDFNDDWSGSEHGNLDKHQSLFIELTADIQDDIRRIEMGKQFREQAEAKEREKETLEYSYELSVRERDVSFWKNNKAETIQRHDNTPIDHQDQVEWYYRKNELEDTNKKIEMAEKALENHRSTSQAPY